MQDLYEMESSKRFEVVFETLHIEPLLFVVNKKIVYGAPTELNYPAMIYTLVVRILERIPTTKDLIHRLKHDFMFRLDCGFLFSDRIPSEASFSRLTSKISESNALESVQETLLLQAIQKGFIDDEAVAIDATHFESRDRSTPQEKKQLMSQRKEDANQKLNKKHYNLRCKIKAKANNLSIKKRSKINYLYHLRP